LTCFGNTIYYAASQQKPQGKRPGPNQIDAREGRGTVFRDAICTTLGESRMNLRKEVRKANLAKWQAQGPGIIERPLRLMLSMFPDMRNTDGSPAGHSRIYSHAKSYAAAGDGLSLTRLARAAMNATA